jgi:hypothetical protein
MTASICPASTAWGTWFSPLRSNRIPLRGMDQIIYPVCKLCWDHERAGFIEGIKIGIQLASELE